MAETVSVVIGTYGDFQKWKPLAEQAMASAYCQTVEPKEVVWKHRDTLAEARNEAVGYTSSEWLVHLDADDTLDEGYIEGILAGTGDLRQPKTLGVYPDGREDTEAVFIPAKSFSQGNYIVVGAGIRRKFFEAAGWWQEEELYEDFALWGRCYLAGAEIGKAPGAIYRVSVGEGRNLPAREKQVYWFEKIVKDLQAQARLVGKVL